MKRVLMIASVASMIDQFNMGNIELLQTMGYEVDVACNFKEGSTCTKERILELKEKLASMNAGVFQVDFSRNIVNIGAHVKAYRSLRGILKDRNYTFVHCHSPIGGLLGRMTAHKEKVKAVYTAHGFHFYKGAPLKNWLIFYPIEKLMSRFTEVLITINQEDYTRARKKFKAHKTFYVSGVGINVEGHERKPQVREALLERLGIPKNARILLSVGELNKNKNHETAIRAVGALKQEEVYYLICGQGERKQYLQEVAEELSLGKRIRFMGFQEQIAIFYESADLFVFPSFREGLSVALMEAISYGLPVVCSDIRGNVDLISEGVNGYLCNPANPMEFADRIGKLFQDREKMEKFSQNSCKRIKRYSSVEVGKRMKEIYSEI